MKKLIFMILSFVLLGSAALVFAGQMEKDLIKKGLHVADLSEEDKINLQVNRLEQAIRQQCIDEIEQMLSPDYTEIEPSIAKTTLNEKLENIFPNLSKVRQFTTQTNQETGWKVTSTQDFYITNPDIRIDGDKATVVCEIGLSSASKKFKGIKDSLSFVLKYQAWLLGSSKNLFGFLEKSSQSRMEEIGTPNLPREVLTQTKDDFCSAHLLVPVNLGSYGKTTIPRFNKTESLNWFGVNCMNSPHGIVADVEYWEGGSDFDHEFLFVSDVTSQKIIGSDQDEWVSEFGSEGSGIGQFWGPHGICNLDCCFYFVADMFNNRVTTFRYEKGWEEPSWECTLTAGFNRPVDVEAKDRNRNDLQDLTYIAVADENNHRIVLFHWFPFPIGFNRAYGQPGSGEGQFMWPTSVCFGRDPEEGWQTNDLLVTDYGNHRLVMLYIDSADVSWIDSYQFPIGSELTSVDVDNKGLAYVVDRHNAKVYKFKTNRFSYPHFTLLGIWGEKGTQDGQLENPNTIQVAHGRYCPHNTNDPCIPLNGLGDVFVTESWGEQTGVRRFVIAADVLNLTAHWVPYNESTGEGNFIWWEYNLTDFATVTEKVLSGAEVCTTYNRGSLNWGGQSSDWPVEGHPHGANYTVKITATSIYDPSIVVEKSVDIYVDTISTHNPIITQGLRCKWIDSTGVLCNGCWQCLKEWQKYLINVQTYDPDGDSLTYEWRCGRGYFQINDRTACNPCITDVNHICYTAPEAPVAKESPPYEFIEVMVRDPYGGEASHSVYTNSIFNYQTTCPCGDVNDDLVVDAGDVMSLINYLFKGGIPPVDPIERGDVNNDCEVGVGDIVYLISYLFKGGDSPECCWIH